MKKRTDTATVIFTVPREIRKNLDDIVARHKTWNFTLSDLMRKITAEWLKKHSCSEAKKIQK